MLRGPARDKLVMLREFAAILEQVFVYPSIVFEKVASNVVGYRGDRTVDGALEERCTQGRVVR